MTIATDFLAAICAAPGDDTPCLIYADWLEEQGQAERAEFIRGMISYMLPSNDRRPLFRRLTKIAAANIGSWLMPLQPRRKWSLRFRDDFLVIDASNGWLGWPMTNLRFRRGFVAELTCSALDWLRHADALAWHPEQKRLCSPTAQPLETVRLTTIPQMVNGPRNGSARLISRTSFYSTRGLIAERDVVLVLLRAEWPGIDFAMPVD